MLLPHVGPEVEIVTVVRPTELTEEGLLPLVHVHMVFEIMCGFESLPTDPTQVFPLIRLQMLGKMLFQCPFIWETLPAFLALDGREIHFPLRLPFRLPLFLVFVLV